MRGLSGGTGSAFSLIPAQNASGNWIKVVQRLPVRIDLDPKELAQHPLRVGLSMKVVRRHFRRRTEAASGRGRRPWPTVQSQADQPGMPARDDRFGLLAITAVALALGTFMQVLDSTIANVSIPTIAGNLGVSTSQGTWVITSFAVANGVSVPLTGWLMMRYGVVKTFVGSVAMFTVASFLCGISWNLPSLIAFRILQGAVSGPMIPGSQALLIMIFPPAQRGHGPGDLVDDHPGRADHRSDPGRLHLRQHLMAVDFPDQPAGGDRLQRALLAQHEEP